MEFIHFAPVIEQPEPEPVAFTTMKSILKFLNNSATGQARILFKEATMILQHNRHPVRRITVPVYKVVDADYYNDYVKILCEDTARNMWKATIEVAGRMRNKANAWWFQKKVSELVEYMKTDSFRACMRNRSREIEY